MGEISYFFSVRKEEEALFLSNICSLLFGPPAAWGAAIGNLVGDILGGTLTAGSIAGFLGNFFYGLLPFVLWRALTRKEPVLNSFGNVLRFVLVCLVSSAACAAVIAAGLELMKIVSWKILLPTIFINNTLTSLVLGAVLLLALYPAARALGLTFTQTMALQQDGERDLDAGESVSPLDTTAG